MSKSELKSFKINGTTPIMKLSRLKRLERKQVAVGGGVFYGGRADRNIVFHSVT